MKLDLAISLTTRILSPFLLIRIGIILFFNSDDDDDLDP